jgi:hypothetical protein
MIEIIKVQRTLMTNDMTFKWLIYDKIRRHVEMRSQNDVPPVIIKTLGDDLKGYFEGYWTAGFGWVIGKRVKNQEWC